MSIALPAQLSDRIVKPGIPWWHLVTIRSRRTHWLIRPTAARSAMRIDEFTTSPITAYTWPWPPDSVPSTVYGGWYPGFSDGGILLNLSGAQTLALREYGGMSFDYDVLADFQGPGVFDYPVGRGSVSILDYDPIAPRLEDDPMDVPLTMTQYEDMTRKVVVPDADGVPEVVTDAYLVAKDDVGATAFSCVWTDPAPDESTIGALPAAQRGYLGPPLDSSYSITLHISNQAVVPADNYRYLLYAQTTASPDWAVRLKGALSIAPGSSPPA